MSAPNFVSSLKRLLDAAHHASELLDGCPDDAVAAAASTGLSEAAAAVNCAAAAELIEAARGALPYALSRVEDLDEIAESTGELPEARVLADKAAACYRRAQSAPAHIGGAA